MDSGFDDEVNWWSMGGNLQEGVALGSRDASYFESTVTAGDMRSFQASYDGRMGNAGGGLASDSWATSLPKTRLGLMQRLAAMATGGMRGW